MAVQPNDYTGTYPNVVLASLATAGDVTVSLPVAAGQRVVVSALGASSWSAGSVLLDRQSNVGKGNWYYTGTALTKNASGSTGKETVDLVCNTNGNVRLRASSDFASGVEVEMVVSAAGRANLP